MTEEDINMIFKLSKLSCELSASWRRPLLSGHLSSQDKTDPSERFGIDLRIDQAITGKETVSQ